MSHSDGAGHGSGESASARGRMALVLGLSSVYLGAEAVSGLATGSLALLADAGHMLPDVLALTLFAMWAVVWPATATPEGTARRGRSAHARHRDGRPLGPIGWAVAASPESSRQRQAPRHLAPRARQRPRSGHPALRPRLASGTDGVAAVHDLHVWSISPESVSMSCHPARLVAEFGIERSSIQVEEVPCPVAFHE